MGIETVLEAMEARLTPWATAVRRPSPERLDVVIGAEDLNAAVATLQADKPRYLAAITGLDHPATGGQGTYGQIEVLYHLCDGAAVVTLRVSVPYDGAVPTLCEQIPSATLYERELMEMFGVTVTGTPDMDRLLLADDWPVGVYPLRKSFQGLAASQSK